MTLTYLVELACIGCTLVGGGFVALWLMASLEGDIQAEREGRPVRQRRLAPRWFCRHDYHLGYEPQRHFLKCATCSRETPGWDLTFAPPRVTAPVIQRGWLTVSVKRDDA